MRAHSISTRHRAVELHKQGISRKRIATELAVDYDVVCDWIKRYLTEGEKGLSSRYHRCGRKPVLAAEVHRAANWLKRLHPAWGAGFIRVALMERYPYLHIPCERQLQVWFRTAGLQPQHTRLPQSEVRWAKGPLDVVQVDAKECMQTADKADCCYLKFTDEHTGSILDAHFFPLSKD